MQSYYERRNCGRRVSSGDDLQVSSMTVELIRCMLTDYSYSEVILNTTPNAWNR